MGEASVVDGQTILWSSYVLGGPAGCWTRSWAEHLLINMVAMATCITECGAEPQADIERSSFVHQQWFEQFSELSNGIPSQDLHMTWHFAGNARISHMAQHLTSEQNNVAPSRCNHSSKTAPMRSPRNVFVLRAPPVDRTIWRQVSQVCTS